MALNQAQADSSPASKVVTQLISSMVIYYLPQMMNLSCCQMKTFFSSCEFSSYAFSYPSLEPSLLCPPSKVIY